MILPSVRPKRLSYSSVDLYRTCARAFWFKINQPTYPVHVPALALGSAIHHAWGELIKANATGKSLFPDKVWEDAFAREFKGFGRPSDREMGRRLLFHPSMIAEIKATMPMMREVEIEKEGVTVLQTEIMVEKELNWTIPGVGIPLKGYIDCVREDGCLIELKSSWNPWSEEKIAEQTQPLFYLDAMRELGFRNNPKNHVRYVIAVKDPRQPIRFQAFDVWFEDREIDEMRKAVVEVWAEMEAGHFPTNGVGTWKCNQKYCDHWARCQGGKIPLMVPNYADVETGVPEAAGVG